jgi:choice-of-anchor C domain-containing protein
MLTRFKTILNASVITLVAMLPTAAKAVNLVQNGSFEKPIFPDLVGYHTLYAGATDLKNWSILSGSIDVDRSYWEASNGLQSLDLSGDDAGVIYQDLSTEIGRSYNLSFDFAGNPDTQSGKSLQVLWSDTPVGIFSFDTSTGGAGGGPTSRADMGWVTKTVQLPAATQSTTRLQFISLTPGFKGPALDNVSVTPGSLSPGGNGGGNGNNNGGGNGGGNGSNNGGGNGSTTIPESSSGLGVLVFGALSVGFLLKNNRRKLKVEG